MQPCRNCILRRIPSSCRPFARADLTPRQLPAEHSIAHQRQSKEPSAKQSSRVAGNLAKEPSGAGDALSHGRDNDKPPLGQLWKSRGAPAFFGSSYFGPQVAAAFLDSPAPYIQPGAGMSQRSTNVRPFRSEAGPFSQMWDLLGLLPRQRSTVDRLINCYFVQLNGDIDAVHEKSFRQQYERFYCRDFGKDDVTTVDIRWLALLFIILAFASQLDCPPDAGPEVQRQYEESSMSFFWACRKAIVIAPSFYGESIDLVRAGILVTRFCIFTQRITESWLTVGFASRLAMAQGFHIDGVQWKLSRRETEIRRRLWCQLYLLDRMISLALGRPYAIVDNLSLPQEPENVFLDEAGDLEAETIEAQPIEDRPTPTVLAIYSYRLAKVIGKIHEQTFGMNKCSYREVTTLEAQLVSWRQSLPRYLALKDPDRSLDRTHRYLKWHRHYLHTAFHFACVTLHRPFVWRFSISDQYRYSREICYTAACADLKTRLDHNPEENADENISWGLGVPRLFNSAIILGMLAIRDQSHGKQDYRALNNDLQYFCEKETSDIWVNDFRLAEVKVIELCIDRLKRGPLSKEATSLTDSRALSAPKGQGQRSANPVQPTQSASQAVQTPEFVDGERGLQRTGQVHLEQQGQHRLLPVASQEQHSEPWKEGEAWPTRDADEVQPFFQPIGDFSDLFSFPGPTDLDTWQGVIDCMDHQLFGEQFQGF
ncbi:putative transcriptional regulatory protein [Cyphellophora attinorum]|uniref:Putative transcriptional regulatory protein n=1 Tax=Cyphellophora attinorum TaxID=1664694 RepID=A0A0N0NI16_9EURO|nr:putative transcriptional regulatory protein [Phialophora attinorum]KPI35321.1 putative transcriptional regulatory protein [Phialophora attinorum]